MQKGFVNFVLGLAPHRLDYLNITCSWGEARIRRWDWGHVTAACKF